MWASKTEINWRMSRLACGCGQLLPTAARTGIYITSCLCASYVSTRVWQCVFEINLYEFPCWKYSKKLTHNIVNEPNFITKIH